VRKKDKFPAASLKTLLVREISNHKNEKRRIQQAECSAIRFPINCRRYRPDLRQSLRSSFL
jgi:uncharacterized protein with von Willebrand factor type A (vWA) domain